jgi:hypothetical protein
MCIMIIIATFFTQQYIRKIINSIAQHSTPLSRQLHSSAVTVPEKFYKQNVTSFLYWNTAGGGEG